MKLSSKDEGKRVILKADEDEGFKEERGVIIDVSPEDNMAMVELDEKYRLSKYDDGLRDVDGHQLELE